MSNTNYPRYIRRPLNETNYANFRSNAINFAIELHNNIQRNINHLPHLCTLLPRGDDDYIITVICRHPNSNYRVSINISIPHNYNYDILNGFAQISPCMIPSNIIFLNNIINTFDDLFDAIAFCHNILPYQPTDEELGEDGYMGYVRVPNNLLNHWSVDNVLRNQNLNPRPEV